jgi:ANTAR domain-containing protein/PAS domain-containing protein
MRRLGHGCARSPAGETGFASDKGEGMSSPAVSRYPLIERPPRQPSPPAHRATAARPSAAARLTGRFRYDRRADAWWWSAEMFTLHGLAPGSPPPDTEAYLQYQHPEDRARVLEALSRACETGQDFALETRTVRADGQKRDVVLVGECRSDDGTAIAAVEGLAVDITECHPPGSPTDRAQALEAEVGQLRAAMASRASIEQAKGILMLLTSCGDQVAFDLLAHISSHTHRKVRDVALVITESAAGRTRLPDDVRAIIRDACPPSQPLG